MKRTSVFAAIVMALTLGAGEAARAECKLQLVTSIPISFVDNQPMVDVSINGKPAHLRFTLGMQTVLWGSAPKDYDLGTYGAMDPRRLSGAGGSSAVGHVQIHELRMGGFTQNDGRYPVALDVKKPNEAGIFGSGAFGGANDVELDFAHNVVRVFRPSGCQNDDVVYWGGNYSVVALTPQGHLPLKIGEKVLNGGLDVGNEATFVTLDGAHHAGIPLRAAGALPMGMLAGAVLKPIEVSIAVVPELTIGDEVIKNMPLAVGDIYPRNEVDMTRSLVVRPEIMLGADFAKSHRIYISRQQKKAYFSYVGGAAFADIYTRLGAERPAAPPSEPKP